MAQIILTSDELTGILAENDLVPQQIAGIEFNGAEISLKLRTGLPLPKTVRVTVRYLGFEDREAVFTVASSRFLSKFDWVARRYAESIPWERYEARFVYPTLYLGVNRLLSKYVRGVQVENVIVDSQQIRIVVRAVESP